VVNIKVWYSGKWRHVVRQARYQRVGIICCFRLQDGKKSFQDSSNLRQGPVVWVCDYSKESAGVVTKYTNFASLSKYQSSTMEDAQCSLQND
jgi:hypothetical protein